MHALKKSVDLAPAALEPSALETIDILRLAQPGAGEAWAAAKPPLAIPASVHVSPGRSIRWLRENAVTMLLWSASLGLLFGFWYLGTKYRWDFYIRFNNIPTPAEVLAKIVEVNKS